MTSTLQCQHQEGAMGRQDRPQADTVGDMTSVDAGEGLPTLGKLELLDVRQV
ncbi:hypothetical protein [Micromonospora narathiwatensis]|uniref:hypothetical protein n=1 Tax=Micromonospora narathiwatensis TaxID=299146 RepID=UPI0012FD9ACE|nr:hypothetical protein [Micromonospora narathiwatensis]